MAIATAMMPAVDSSDDGQAETADGGRGGGRGGGRDGEVWLDESWWTGKLLVVVLLPAAD